MNAPPFVMHAPIECLTINPIGMGLLILGRYFLPCILAAIQVSEMITTLSIGPSSETSPLVLVNT